jgi:hypothetical protein
MKNLPDVPLDQSYEDLNLLAFELAGRRLAFLTDSRI